MKKRQHDFTVPGSNNGWNECLEDTTPYPITLLYPFEDSDDMWDAFLLAFYQRSLWASVSVHVHLRDKGPAIPADGTPTCSGKARYRLMGR